MIRRLFPNHHVPAGIQQSQSTQFYQMTKQTPHSFCQIPEPETDPNRSVQYMMSLAMVVTSATRLF